MTRLTCLLGVFYLYPEFEKRPDPVLLRLVCIDYTIDSLLGYVAIFRRQPRVRATNGFWECCLLR